jgi:MraZ protein
VFQGESALVMDAKGRITIPQRIRDAFAVDCGNRLTLVRNPDGCLMIYPRNAWEAKRVEIAGWPMSGRGWSRMLLGSAADVECDGAGRITISPELRRSTGLTQKDVLMRGAGRYYELWDAAVYAQVESQAIAQGMPQDLGSFTF